MKAHEALRKAIACNRGGKFRQAATLLEALRDRVPEHPIVLKQLATACHRLGEVDTAVSHLKTLHDVSPNDRDAWQLHISMLADPGDRLPVIDAAVDRFPADHGLRLDRAGAALENGDWPLAERTLAELVERVPDEERAGCLRDFAEHAVAAARTDTADGRTVVRDAAGQAFHREALELARRACGFVLEHGSDTDWQTWYQLADIERTLGQLASATVSYRRAEAQLGPDHPSRAAIADAIRECEQEGGEADDRESVCAGSSAGIDQDQAVAFSIARDIHRMVQVPAPDFAPADPGDFPRSARQHCERQEQALRELGFKPLGDYEPRHLGAQLGRPTFIRFMRDGDGEIVAANYRVYPRRPDGWLRLLMLVLGQWKRPKVIEFQSELSDGRFVITNNTAGLDPFEGGPDFFSESFPARKPARRLLDYHRQVLADLKSNNPGLEVVAIPDFAALVASEERQQALKTRYRRKVGLATEDELRLILGRQYDRYGDCIRDCLADLMARDSEMGHEPQAG